MIIKTSEHKIDTQFGTFIYTHYIYGPKEQNLVVLRTPNIPPNYYLRIQHGCILGTVFKSTECDCGEQLNLSLKCIAERGGILLYFVDNEGHGLGLAGKSKMQMEEIKLNKSFPQMMKDKKIFISETNLLRIVPEVLEGLKLDNKIQFITNNPRKVSALKKLGIDVVNVIPTNVDFSKLSDFAKKELSDKKSMQGHTIDI